MSTKFKITFNVFFNNHNIYIRGLETSLLLWSSGARLHGFGLSTSTSSNNKCCLRSFSISKVVITYYVRGVFFNGVAVCIIIPGFKISKVQYYSMVFSDAFFNLFPPVHTYEFMWQVVVAAPFPVSLFSTAPVFHTVKPNKTGFFEGSFSWGAGGSNCYPLPHPLPSYLIST